MRRLSTALLALFITLVFLTYMVTYTVRYDEVAILTTFEQADEPDQAAIDRGENSGSVIKKPGLYFKFPWPIQRVETYPTRLQVLEDQPEEIRLKDGNTVIVNMAVTWRVDDPLAFYRSLESVEEAQQMLRPQMSDLRKVLSQYRFDQFVNEKPEEVQLDQIELEIAETFRNQIAGLNYGIAIEQVTMGKLLYNTSTATKVNERMTVTQNRLAQSIRSQGDAEAQSIRTEAINTSSQIMSFANNAATSIEAIGERESARLIGQLADSVADERFAAFLIALETNEKILANKTIFVIDGRENELIRTFLYGPDEAITNPGEDAGSRRPVTPLRPELLDTATTTDPATSTTAETTPPTATGARP